MSEITKRSQLPDSPYYANVRLKGVRLRDCLNTCDPNIAMERLRELKIMVRRGEYQKGSTRFDKLVEAFKDPSLRDKGIIRVHLTPAFKGQRVWDMDIQGFLDSIADKQSQSSMDKICATMRKLKLDVPTGKSNLIPKEFGADKILTDAQIENVIDSYVPIEYRAICWIAVFSCLRMSDVLNLKKSQVQFKGPKPGINLVPGKTRKKHPKMLHIPMSKPLQSAFSRVKVWPFREEDIWFPALSADQVKQAVSGAFTKAGVSWGSFIQFRHFGACFLLGQGVSLEELQIILHHKSIKTTQIYARVTGEAITNAVAKFENFGADARTQTVHKREGM